VTDGSVEGTRLLKDIYPGSCDSNIAYLVGFTTAAGEHMAIFQAEDGVHGRELWATDGTASGTVMLYDIRVGGLGSSPSYFATSIARSDLLYFTVSASANFEAEHAHGRETLQLADTVSVWQTDGTRAGTRPVFQRTQGDLSLDHLALQQHQHPPRLLVVGDKLITPARMIDKAEVVYQAQSSYKVPDTQPFVIEDVDAGGEELLTLRLNVERGFLGFVDGSLIQHAYNHTGVPAVNVSMPDIVEFVATDVSLTAHLPEINRMVRRGLFYSSAAGMNGWDNISITVHNHNAAAAPTVTAFVAVFVEAVNQPPVITAAVAELVRDICCVPKYGRVDLMLYVWVLCTGNPCR
jgi:ELWxxDGT repeat protein